MFRTLAIVALFVATSAFASAQESDKKQFLSEAGEAIIQMDIEGLEQMFAIGPRDHHHKACSNLKLTEEQSEQIKKAMQKLKRDSIQLKADIEVAKLDYMYLITDETSKKADADAAATNLTDSVGAMMDAHLGFVNDVLYDILTPEQRRPALSCMHAMKEHKKKKAIAKLCKQYNQRPRPKPTVPSKPTN